MIQTFKTNNFSPQVFAPVFIILLFFGVNSLTAQQIGGPTDVEKDTPYNYVIQGNTVGTPSWSATGGSISGTPTSTAEITWTQTGFGKVFVSYSDGNTTHNLDLDVTISNPPPPAPDKPEIDSNGCGEAALKRVGSPTTGVKWYWQGKNSQGKNDDPSDEATTSPYPLTEGSGVYYIRAKKKYWGMESFF